MNPTILEIEDLHAGVEGKQILKGVDLTISAGEVHETPYVFVGFTVGGIARVNHRNAIDIKVVAKCSRHDRADQRTRSRQ